MSQNHEGSGKTSVFLLGILVGMLIVGVGVGWYALTEREEAQRKIRQTELLLKSTELSVAESKLYLWRELDEAKRELAEAKASRPAPQELKAFGDGEILKLPQIEADKE